MRRIMKSVVSAAVLTATLALTVPAAAAVRPSQGREAVSQRDEPRVFERAARAVRRVVSRLGVGTLNWPIPPIPVKSQP